MCGHGNPIDLQTALVQKLCDLSSTNKSQLQMFGKETSLLTATEASSSKFLSDPRSTEK